MKFTPTALDGVWLIEPEPVSDERGWFARIWCTREFAEHGLNPSLVQCSVSYNRRRGTLRGLHYQAPPHAEAKLVRCTRGAIWDVAVDVREGSPDYGRWVGERLGADDHRMLYIPEGFAHGFLTLEDDTEVVYQMSAFHEPDHARVLRWDDPAIGVEWPFAPCVLSAADRRA